MRKTILATAVAAAAAMPGLASAQASSPHSISGNLTIASDYRFRGISQTFVQPTIQGGIDYAHKSGFYLGNWNSNVNGLVYTDGSIEMDIYGGYKFGAGPIAMDVGLLQYMYPGAKTAAGDKYDTMEAYFAGTWKWFTVKYSYALTDFFGAPDSDGSGYLDLTFNYEIAPKFNLVAHYGMQTVENVSGADYDDYKVGITYDLNGWLLGAAYVDTDTTFNVTNAAGKTEDLAKGTVVLSVSKSF
ncbi:MAG: TorF family putative porin [Betaproteobacteria bacterium]|nr:TorF family putative porin [Betaproteobacteria bacterium]MDH5223046.1 TorF family putative porin [Betaproteobacteria bacterium]MDH5349431.1 TorF family putative porin [Betaproteobacteria bacterium]